MIERSRNNVFENRKHGREDQRDQEDQKNFVFENVKQVILTPDQYGCGSHIGTFFENR